jgi:outer membrane protein W
MRTVPRVALTAVLLSIPLAAAPPAAAQSWTFRGGPAWVDPDIDLRQTDGLSTISLQSSSAIGAAASAEYHFTDRFGLEIGLLWAEPEIELRIEGFAVPLPDPLPPLPDEIVASGDLRFTPLTVGLNVHFSPGAEADLYVGPRLAFVQYGDLELTSSLFGVASTTTVGTDDELGYGAGIGLDVPVGAGRWLVNASADFLEVDLTFSDEGAESLAFDPLIVRAGVGYRF